MRQIVIALTLFGLLLLISGCNGKQPEPPKPTVIQPMRIPQVPYPEVTNVLHSDPLENSKQCVINYYLMKEAFTECSNNAKIGQ